jgi:hypothetical protein
MAYARWHPLAASIRSECCSLLAPHDCLTACGAVGCSGVRSIAAAGLLNTMLLSYSLSIMLAARTPTRAQEKEQR